MQELIKSTMNLYSRCSRWFPAQLFVHDSNSKSHFIDRIYVLYVFKLHDSIRNLQVIDSIILVFYVDFLTSIFCKFDAHI